MERLAAIHPDNGSLIDVRERDEYISGHVPGAISIPLSELAARANEVPTTGTVHVICAAGGRSAQAIQFLEGHGADFVNVLGGTNEWRDRGHDLATGEDVQ